MIARRCDRTDRPTFRLLGFVGRVCGFALALAVGLGWSSMSAFGALTVDNATVKTSSSGNSMNWLHTVSAGSDRLLVVTVSLENSANQVNSITYNGIGLTFVGANASGTYRVEIWYLAAPSTGSSSVVVTQSGTSDMVGGAVSFLGAHQTAPLGTVVSAFANSPSPSVTVASAAGEIVLDTLCSTDNAVPITAGGGQTEHWNTSTTHISSGGSTQAGAASVTMTWTLGSSGGVNHNWVIDAVAVKPVTAIVSGTVFEDVNYGGGAGRSLISSSGSRRSGARVELYDSGGNFVTFATTDGSGNYSFPGLVAGNFTVRVVNGGVSSSRGGAPGPPVQTFRTNGLTGTVGTADPNRVGGENPALVDAGNGSTTLAALTTAATTAESITPLAVGTSDITGIDFGFNFDTIVNKNNTGQGSLRQVVTNANTLGGDGSLAQSGLVAGKENAVFMISNGTAAAGLRAANSYFVGGVATIALASTLPSISAPLVLDAQKQPGWSAAPIIELNGAGAGGRGIDLTGGGSTVRGFVLNRFTAQPAIYISGAGSNTIQGNYIGTNAAGTAASANVQGIYVANVSSDTIGGTGVSQGNVISGNNGFGISTDGSGTIIQGNFIGTNAAGAAAVPNTSYGVYATATAAGVTIGGTAAGSSNVISGNASHGITLFSNGHTVQGNKIGINAAGSAAIANQLSGIFVTGANNTIGGGAGGASNTVADNTQAGIVISSSTATGNRIQQNSVYGNGALGIDLAANGVTANDGAKTANQPNLLMDFPVFTSATLVGTTLTVAGYVGSAANQATFAAARVEIFKSDNDASGNGEGQTYLGFLNADASGNISGSITTGSLALGDKITATATDGSNNTSEFGPNFPVIAKADLSLTKTDSPDPAPAGGELLYNLLVTNNGPNSATGVTLTDTLPAGVTFVSANPTQGSCSGTTTVTCNLGGILSGGTVSIEILVVTGSAGTITNNATVAATQTDPVAGNNAASATTTIVNGGTTDIPLTLYRRIHGFVDYTTTGGSLRTAANGTNPCAVGASSTASVSGIPATATVVAAYLYWAGSSATLDNQVTLDGTSLTADRTWTAKYVTGPSTYDFFGGFKDVTAQVTAKRNGSYTFAGLTVNTGSPFCGNQTVLAGWSMITIYQDASLTGKTLVLYDGFDITRNELSTYNLAGIFASTPPQAKTTVLAWEGDDTLSGANELLKFDGTALSDALDPVNNVYNGTINTLGVNNSYGVDLDTYDVSSLVAAKDTLATMIVSTDADMVIANAVVLQVKSNVITGTVYEDLNYGGGAGRNLASSAGMARPGATVELYDSAGNLLRSTTTAADGGYGFAGLIDGDYVVRVVNGTVTSSRPGAVAGLWPVQTYRADASTGSAVGVTAEVGGSSPPSQDAGANVTNANLGSFTAQSKSPARIITGVAVTNVDFGYSFDTIVNKNDAGQGSLRQFVVNSNTLGNAGLAISGQTAGKDVSIFMLSDGLAHPGLKVGLPNQLGASGAATITLASALPAIGVADTTIDGGTQTTNVGDTNSGKAGNPTLPQNAAVGTGPDGIEATGDEPTLPNYNKPEVEINGGAFGTGVLQIAASNTRIERVAVYNSSTAANASGVLVTGGTGSLVNQCFVGPRADGSDPGAAARLVGGVLTTTGAADVTANFVGYVKGTGIQVQNAASVTGNDVYSVGLDPVTGLNSDGISTESSTGQAISIVGNRADRPAAIGIETWAAPGPFTITDNSVFRSHQAAASVETEGIRIFGLGSTVSRNVVTGSGGAGIGVVRTTGQPTGTRNVLSKNATYQNGGLGIDLDVTNTGAVNPNGDGVTPNDGATNVSVPNIGFDYPVITLASLSAGTLTVTGYVGTPTTKIAGTHTLEFFKADNDGNNNGPRISGDGLSLPHGEGRFTLGTCTTAADGSFTCNLVAPAAAALAVGDLVTATARDANGNTSEFGVDVTVVALGNLSGTVFEDANYGGGSGRDRTTAGGAVQSGATVELYDNTGAFVASATTDASGSYTFTSIVVGTYTVRVVNASVHSSRAGYVAGLLPVQTFRTSGLTGTVGTPDPNRVGGETPSLIDAAANVTNATLASLTTASATPQSITSVTVGASGVTGIDFGFNFDTIVNKNDTGQGSLRQFITNASTLGNGGLAQVGQTAGKEVTIFMLSDGAAHAGLRAGLSSQLTGGVAVINVTTGLPTITGADTVVDGSTQTGNVGNTNPGTLGAGGTVGVDALALTTVAAPEVQLSDGGGTLFNGLAINANNVTVRGIAVFGFGSRFLNPGDQNIRVDGGTGILIENDVIGSTATGFTDPGAATRSGNDDIDVIAGSGIIQNNLIGFAACSGIGFAVGTSTWTVQGNELRANSQGNTTCEGWRSATTGHTVSGNLVIANRGSGFDLSNSTFTNLIENNTVTGNGIGAAPGETGGVRVTGAGGVVRKNVVFNNFGAGVLIPNIAGSVTITLNSIYANGTIANEIGGAPSGEIGIDLLIAADDQSHGTAPFVTVNDSGDGDSGGNGLYNMPVFTSARIVGANLVVNGFVRPGSVIELFIAAPDPSGFGEGQTYLATLTEGSAADTDAGVGTYGPGAINGILQGLDAASRFTFTLPVPGGVALGTTLTGTARGGSAATSEFSGNVTVSGPASDLQITKTDGVVSATPGTSITYTIQVTNLGPDAVAAAAIADTFAPAYFNPAAVTWTCAITSGTGACGSPSGSGNIATTVDLNPAAVATYTVTAPILPGATGTITNTATAASPSGNTDPAPGNNSATDGNTVLAPSANLSITKNDGVATYTPGGTVTYTIVVGNAGPSAVTGATVTDTVLALAQVQSASWTCVAASGATCTAGPIAGNISDTVNVPVGGTATYTLVVTTKPAASGDLVNAASVAPPAGASDPVGGNNTASDTDTAARGADLSITKNDGVASYVAGSPVTYTIVVANAGPSDAVGATVTDTVSALPQVLSASWTCVGAGGATCTAGPVAGNINDTVNVPRSGTLTYTLVATTKSSATGNLVNTAAIAPPAGTTDPGPGANSATDTDTPATRISDLAITKGDGATSYLAGGSVTYTIVVSNAGPSDVVGATVTDAVLALPQVASASWTCAGAGGATCSAGPTVGDINDTVNVPVGGTATYTLVAVTKPSAAGDLVNTASVTPPAGTTDPGPGANNATDTDTPATRVSDMSITKDDGVTSYVAGSSVTYTIVVSNAGPSDAVGATVTDTVLALPQVQAATWTCVSAGGATCTAGPVAGNISDTVDVPKGGTLTYTLVVVTKSSATGDLTNTGNVMPPSGTADPGPGANSATDTDTAAARISDLTITKTDGVPSYVAGNSVTYTIVVGNAGPSDAVAANVSDAVMALPQVQAASFTCVGAGGATCMAGPGAGNINDTVNVPVGGTLTYTMTVTTKSSATGNLVNTASVLPPAGTTDPGPGANSATDTDTAAAPSSDLSITKDDGVLSYVAGGSVTYTIVVSNAGPSDAVGATVTDPVVGLPQRASGSWTCVGTGGASCTAGPSAGNINDVVNLPVGGTLTYTMVFTTKSSATGNLVNTATVATPSGTTDPGPGVNSATDTDTPASRSSDLSITKDDGVPSYLAGSSVTYTIVVSNAGPSDAVGATVSDAVMALPQVQGATWTCVGGGGATCTAGPVAGSLNDTVNVPNGGTLTYTLVVTTKPNASSDLVNTASVAPPAGTTDPGPGADTATDTDTETRGADLSITKSDGVASYTPGGSVTYTIVVSNAGPSDALGATVTDLIMSRPQVASAIATCVGTGGATCAAGPNAGDINDIVNVPRGGTLTYTLLVATKPSATGDLTNAADVSPPVGTTDPGPGVNSASDTDTAAARVADLSIAKDDGVASYVAGNAVTYTIVVSNAGPSDAVGATVSDAVMALSQVQAATWTCVGAGGATCAAGPVAGNINDTVDVPRSGTLTYTLLVTTKPSAAGNLVNTVSVAPAAGTTDPGPGANSATDTDTPAGRISDLAITKTDGAPTYVPGNSVTYTIVVSNAGPSDAVAATVTDAVMALPQVQAASWTCVGAGGATCTTGPAAGSINDTVNVPRGGTLTYTLVLTTRPSASGDLVNTASVLPPAGTTDPGPGANSATDTDTAAARISDLSITKTDGLAAYVAGTSVTYAIVVSNAGPSNAVAATVADDVMALPQVQAANWTCVGAGGATCTAGPSAGSINDTVDVPVGGTLTYTMVVTTKSSATGSLVNTASVTPPAGTTDPGPGANSATDTDTAAAPSSDLSITKTDGAPSYLAGNAVTYTIVVANAGPSDAVGATVGDAVMALPQVQAATWTCVGAGGATCTAGPAAGNINDTVNVPRGGTLTYTLAVTTRPSAAGDLVNTASVTPPAGTTDPGPGANSASDTDTPAAPVSDLSITKTDGVPSYLAGNSVTYTIVVGNAGPSDAVGATVSDAVMALAQVQAATWSCVGVGGATCTAGPTPGNLNDTVNVPVGGTLTYTLVVTTRSGAAGNLVNTATIAPPAGTSDPGAGNNSATDTDTPAARVSDLSIAKSDGVATYVAGDSVTYTIVVSNAGPSDATGATVTDSLLALPQVASASWTCVGSGGATCAAGPTAGNINDTVNVPVGGTATYTLFVTTKPSAAGNLVNTASVLPPAGTSDPGPGPDSATDTDTLAAGVSDLSITKTDGVTSYIAGNAVTYTIVVSNAGPSDAVGATVTDAVLALPQVASASWTCVGAGGATCAAGPTAGNINDTVNVPVGGTATYTLVATTKSSAAGNLVNTASIAPAAGTTDPGAGNNSATDTDTPALGVSDLSITKTDGVASYVAGNAVTYTIVVSNAGPSDAVGATVTDAVLALPQVASASWTCVAAGGATCAAGPTAGNINDTVTVPVGGTATYTVVVTTKSSAAGNLVNTASIAPPAGTSDPGAGNNSVTDTDTPAAGVSDLSITKSDGVASYVAGNAVTYAIVVGNAGPSDAVGATVTDAVLAVPQVASASWTCVGAGGATCAAGPTAGNINDTVNVPVGGTATYTVVVTTKASAAGNLVNTASIAPAAGTTDPGAGNNSATDTDTPASGISDLSITKTDGVASYVAGNAVTYTIVVSNAGPSDVSGATVTDAVLALAQVASASWTCVGAGGATCAAGPTAGNINDTVNVPVGGTATYTIVVTTKSSAAGNLVNTASVAPPAGTSDPGAGNNSATDTDTPAAGISDLSITKTDGVASYVAGNAVTYTIVVSNAGPSDVSSATVTDAVLALPQVASASWTCVGAGGATCAAGPTAGNINDTVNVPVGGTASYTVVVMTKASAAGNLANTASVAPPAGTSDPGAGNNSATDTDTPAAGVSDLSITKTDGVASYVAGNTVTYTIVVSNAGPSDAAGATVTDAVLALAQVASASWTCVGAGGATCAAGPTAGNINDTVNVPVGGTLTYTLVVTTRPSATSDLVNTASIAPPAGTTDPVPGNDSATDTDTETQAADLSITKTDGVTSAVPGQSVTYTIVVGNAGPSNVTNASVSDTFDATKFNVPGVSWTCAITSGTGSCGAPSGVGNIATTVSLDATAVATYTVTAPILPGATGTLSNSATVSSSATDPAPANNAATDGDTVLAATADLSITKTDGVTAAVPGQSVTYTIVVGNAGPSNVTNAAVTDTFDATKFNVPGVSWTCAITSGTGSCGAPSGAGNIATTVSLNAAAVATYTVTAPILATATGTLSNTATVSSTATDPAPANNAATDGDTALAATADLSITKTDGVTSAVPGQSVTYTIAVGNAGPSNVSNAAVADTFDPAKFNVPSVSWTCAITSGTGTCGAPSGAGNIATTVSLNASAIATYTVTAPILAAATGTLSNTATVSSSATDPAPANNSATDGDTVLAATADLSITKTDGVISAVAGQSLNYTIVVSNAGPSSVVNAAVADTLDATKFSVLSVSWTCAITSGTGSCGAASGNGNLATTVSLNAGAGATYTVTAPILPGATGTLSNTATVSSTATDPAPANNAATDGDTVLTATADLSITKTDGVTTAVPGQSVTYTIVVSNAGPSSVANAAVGDTIDPTKFNVPGVSWTCSITSGTGSCGAASGSGDLATTVSLNPGAGATYLVTAPILPGATGTLSNTATVSSTATDPTPANDAAIDGDTVLVVSSTVLRITKTAGEEFAVVGSVVPYVLRLENLTAGPLANVSVTDNIPAGFKLVPESTRIVRAGSDGLLGTSDDVASGVAAAGARPVDFGPLALGPGEIVLVRYLLRVGSGVAQGKHVNQATPNVDGSPAGASASASVIIVADPTFDQCTIIGKVFEDVNGNGRPDPEEPGVGRAMVALDNGTYALTDDDGRYHFPAVDPGQRMVKLNLLSLSPGSTASGEVSRILTLTPGLMAKANFGVVLARHSAGMADRQVPALAVASRAQSVPVDVRGSAEALTALVNGTAVTLDPGDAQLRVAPLDDVIALKGEALAGPVRFDLAADGRNDVKAWKLVISNGHGDVVKQFDGASSVPPAITWDGHTQAGGQIAAGEIYQYRLETTTVDGEVLGSPVRLFGVNRVRSVAFDLNADSFETGREELTPKAKLTLAKIAEAFRHMPDEKIVIEGHTDNVGGDAYNLELSKRRATAALRCLVDEHGLAESQFILKWYGKTRPIAQNSQPEGRMMNRRVSIKAEKEEVEDRRPDAAFHTAPSVTINGTPVAVGAWGRFSGQVDDEKASRIAIDVTDSNGRTAKLAVTVPTFEIVQPRGELKIMRGASGGGCRAGADGVADGAADGAADGKLAAAAGAPLTCDVRGKTDPGNVVTIQGVPAPVGPDGSFETPVHLPLGRSTIGIVVRNHEGFDRIANLEVEVSDRDAGGGLAVVTQPVPGLTINLPPQGASLKVQLIDLAGATEPGNEVWINGVRQDVDTEGRFATSIELHPGPNHIEVKVRDASGGEGTLERDVVVAKNELFLMAFADGVIGRMKGSGLVEAAGLDSKDAYYANGRVAYYLKGSIAGKFLITSAFDSGNTDTSSAFRGLDPETSRRLLTNLDPDKIYPVYGDASTVVYDAESQGKFYLALDSEEIHVLIGNYPLTMNDTELAAYRRTLYGGRFIYQSVAKTAYGQPDTQVVVFGAQARNAHVRDAIDATGGSLYYLSHHDLVQGSEEVTLVVRDVNTGLMLSLQRQQRNIDYTIKYDEGRIVFNRPISSVVDSGGIVSTTILSGNPVRVQVDYEAVTGNLDKTATGARAQQHLGDHFAVGATYVKDELDSGRHELAGVDTEVRVGKATRFTAEYAQSSGVDSIAYVSGDGGITYTAAPATGAANGGAWKAAAELDLGEWFGKPGLYSVRAYYKKIDPGFFASGTYSEQGTEKTGINANLRFGAKDTLQLRFDHENLESPVAAANGQNTIGSVQWNHTEKRWGIDSEVHSNDTENAASTSRTKSALAAVRLWMHVTEKVTGYLQRQQTLTGSSNNQTTAGVTYQVSKLIALDLKATDGSIGRSAQGGASLRVGESDIYLTQRAAEDQAGRKNTTILGARSPLGPSTKIFGEYQWEDADAGARKTALVGAQRKWDLARGWNVLLGAEAATVHSGQTLNAQSTDTSRTAISGTVAYAPSDKLTASARTEARWEKSDTPNAVTGSPINHFQLFAHLQVDYKLDSDLKLIGSYRFSRTTDQTTSVQEARFDERSLGLAYRPVHNDRFNALARYTHLYELAPQSLAGATRSERTLDVLSAEGIYDFGNGVEWFAKLAARRRQDVLDDATPISSETFLAIQRLNLIVRRPFEFGVEYRMLAARQADDRRQGFLLEAMWALHKYFRLGTGYNFTDFSDNEFASNDYRVHGWFVRAQARF